MAPPSGYRPLNNKARQYEGPNGEILSHRQFRNIVVRQSGWRSLHELETSQGWAKFREKILDAKPRADVSYSSRSAADYAKVKHQRERGRKAEKPGKLVGNTALGRLLIDAGIRDEGDVWGDY